MYVGDVMYVCYVRRLCTCVCTFVRVYVCTLYFVRVPNETKTTKYWDFEEFLQQSYRIFVKRYNTFFRGFSGDFCPNTSTLLFTYWKKLFPNFLLLPSGGENRKFWTLTPQKSQILESFEAPISKQCHPHRETILLKLRNELRMLIIFMCWCYVCVELDLLRDWLEWTFQRFV